MSKRTPKEYDNYPEGFKSKETIATVFPCEDDENIKKAFLAEVKHWMVSRITLPMFKEIVDDGETMFVKYPTYRYKIDELIENEKFKGYIVYLLETEESNSNSVIYEPMIKGDE